MAYKGFLVTGDYDVTDKGAIIHLYGRLDSGESFHANIPQKPYFFIQTKDVRQAKKFTTADIEETKLKTLGQELVSKVTLINPKEVPQLRKVLEDENIPCYEADIRFVNGYLMHKDIFATIELKGKPKKGEFTDLIFEDPDISQTEIETKPTLLSFDLETLGDMSKILSVSLYGDKKQSKEFHKEVIVIKNSEIEKIEKELDYVTVVEDEKELLELFLKRVHELDPDILTGWNVIDFDMALLAKRFKNYNMNFNLGRSKKTTTMRIESSFFRDSAVNIQGRLVLDGIQLLKSSFVKLDSYTLNSAAKHFLDQTKLIQQKNRFNIIEDAYHKDPKLFLEYNLKDSILVYDILDVSGVLNLTIQRSILTGMFMDRVKASIASFDSVYLRELRKAGYVAISTRPNDREAGLGGYVLKSKPGIYKNVAVFDFKSLYPSIMRTFNIDPLAYVGNKEEVKDYNNKDKYIVSPNGAVISQVEGLLPSLLTTLWNKRDEAKKAGNELARYAIKILMNSMYGVLASPNSRFHNRTLSNAITYFGQHFIKLMVEELKKKGYDVIYGDTDSVFVDIKTDDIVQADTIAKQIEKDFNIFFKEHIKEQYKRDSILELEYEKLFLRFFMPTVRGSEEGAKKRYAGLKLVSGVGDSQPKTKLDFTGLEFVRRDWTEVSKVFQLKLLDLIFTDKPVEDYIKNFVDEIKSGKHDNLLVYKKALRKQADQYTKTTPPHVKAARLMDKIENNVISYVLTIDGPQPVELKEDKLVSKLKEGNLSQLDYDHYIEKQIKPIAESVLKLQNRHFDNVIQGVKQTGLGSFM